MFKHEIHGQSRNTTDKFLIMENKTLFLPYFPNKTTLVTPAIFP